MKQGLWEKLPLTLRPGGRMGEMLPPGEQWSLQEISLQPEQVTGLGKPHMAGPGAPPKPRVPKLPT